MQQAPSEKLPQNTSQPVLQLTGNVRTKEELAHVFVHPLVMTTLKSELTQDG